MAHPIDEFGLRLYSRVCTTPGNLFFSPYSIWACLALVRAGARGETAAELDALFGYPEDLHAFQSALRESLEPGDVRESNTNTLPAYALNIANALWGQEGWPFEKAFIDTLEAELPRAAGANRLRPVRSGARAHQRLGGRADPAAHQGHRAPWLAHQ